MIEILEKIKSFQPGEMTDKEMEFLYNSGKNTLVDPALEIGTGRGISTCCLAAGLAEYSTDGYIDTIDYNQASIETAITRIGQIKCSKFVKFILGRSPDDLPDKIYSFIFIDANHDHPHIDNDLAASLIRLRNCGVICGHDFTRDRFDVKEAVLLTISKTDNITLQDGVDSIWVARKNAEYHTY